MFAIASFEFRSRLKLLSSWVYFGVFLALAMLWIAAAGGLFIEANISFGSGKVFVNSPFALAQTIAVLGMLGVTVMAAIMGRAVQQDYEYRTHNFFFSAPISKAQYLGGRFAGALGVVLVVFTSIGLGAWLATLLPGIDVERLGPNQLGTYLRPYLFVLLPNALLIGGVFFSLAALTRKMLPVYVGGVLVLLGSLVAQQLLRDMDNKTAAALIDPFGSRAMSIVSEYWTVAERNTRPIPFEGLLLWNRVLWVGVAMGLSGLCFWRFSFSAFANEGVSKRENSRTARPEPVSPIALSLSKGGPDTSRARLPSRSSGQSEIQAQPERAGEAWQASPLRLLPHLIALNLRETVKNIYFGVLVLAGLAAMVISSFTLGDIFGTSTWPLTFQMIELVSGSFALFMLIIITFYAGEMVWREREQRLDQIVDALPVPTWLPLVSKLLALMAVPALLQALLMLCGMAIQLAHGFTHFEPAIYLQSLFGIDLVNYWLLCALAIAVQSVVNHKYVGHFVMIVYFAVMLFSPALGLHHGLYRFAFVPPAVYSDLNGWGHFLPRVWAYQAYWGAASLVLLVLAYLLWTRGSQSGWRERLKQASARLTSPTLAAGGIALALCAGLGGFIFYNTNVLNIYSSEYDDQKRQADYEKKYKPLAAEPQPKITGVTLDVALYPAEQRVRVRGSFTLQNKTGLPVNTLNLGLLAGQRIDIRALDIGVPAQQVEDDKRLGLRRYKPAQPLAPGAITPLAFDLEQATHGFTNEGSNTAVVYNGSFLNGRAVLPVIGYLERLELERDLDRRKFGLAPKERMRDRDDPRGLQANGISPDADFVSFDATVSTEPDQIAIAPGYLQREWTDAGRRYFHYKMDAPILNFYAFQSARYARRLDKWKDVAIEVYYHPGHEFNIDSMIASVKASLDYNGRNFGAYQYRQFRIIEFPRYATFAQAFPNTIPYSEQIGFIARVRPDDEKDIDYPYYVTAHEAGHQWWGHQVAAADVQGGSMLIESLAQYSALMVMKRKVGETKMRRFLAYELDHYLRDRGFEQKKELPLARVENQDYIHYRKGSLVLYALADYIGEDTLNRAIRKYRDTNAFKGPPYPNATQFIALLREVTPPEMQYLIDDMFERIVVYDNRALSATAKALPGGRWQVDLKVFAKKRVADALGKEDEVALADLVDIGVLDDKDEPIVIERRRIDKEESSFSFTIDKKPAKAGIDPLNKLIDRKPKDNTVAVVPAP